MWTPFRAWWNASSASTWKKSRSSRSRRTCRFTACARRRAVWAKRWNRRLRFGPPRPKLEKAQAAMNAIGARIAETYPDSNKGWGVTVDRFEDQIVGRQLRRSLFVLVAAVGAILLIGCANLANLTLARGASREREIAVRASLGAGSWRLIRQLLTENLLI